MAYDDVLDESQIAPTERQKVKELCEEVRDSREYFGDDFKRMDEDAKFHYGLQWMGQSSLRTEFRYICNIAQRFVKTKTDALYAKDPQFTAKRRPRMDFVVWDEQMSTLMQVEQRVARGMVTPQDMELLMDIKNGLEVRKMLDSTGRTMEILMQHYTSEQTPSFKMEMKRLVRRASVMGVSYVKLGFQRMMSTPQVTDSRLADARARIEHLECLLKDAGDPEKSPERAELEELRAMMMTQSAAAPMREGPIFDFPAPNTIIPDRETTAIVGWRGTRFIGEQFIWRRSRIKEKFKINVGTTYTPYIKAGGTGGVTEDARFWDFMKLQGQTGKDDPFVCWWYVWDKRTGLVYTIADGYPGYLSPPAPPEVKLEQFFPIYPFATNDVESDSKIFPPSDVRILRSMQEEYNRKREGVRQHRIANRPLYVMAAESAEREDIEAVTSEYPDHAIIKLKALAANQKVGDLFQQLVKAPITAELYETETDFADMQRAGGAPAPVFGELSGATATETSVAEGVRTDSNSSNIDDLEMMLSQLARDTSITMLRELSFETVRGIVGPGAVWPTYTGEEVARELYLEIEAGSTGRPNAAQKVAIIERLSSLIVQLPGISPEKLARHVIHQMDPDIDLTDWYEANTPSIQALNAAAKPSAAQPGTGDPATDPSQQGPAGALNAPRGAGRPTGAQPAFPAPTMAPQISGST